MVNSSLAYEILLYLNSFYFGMFAACEVGMGVLKGINMNYTPQELQKDASILVAILVVETFRVFLGRKGSLSEHGNIWLCIFPSAPLHIDFPHNFLIGWQVITSVFLTIPCACGVYYLLMLQNHLLKLELILCALMLTLQCTELIYAILFLFSTCRPTTYT